MTVAEEVGARVAASLGEQGGILVLRHSVREAITVAEVAAAMAAPLTDEGRALSCRLGELLPAAVPLRLFWSPVPRCEETAALIGEGALARGCRVELAGARDYLGALYVLDGDGVTRQFARLGQHRFVAAWLGEKLPAGLLKPAPEAGRQLLAALFDEHGTDGGRLDLHVTHDLTLVTLLSLVCDVCAAGFRWPGYLEGALLLPRDGELLWDYGGRPFRSDADQLLRWRSTTR